MIPIFQYDTPRGLDVPLPVGPDSRDSRSDNKPDILFVG